MLDLSDLQVGCFGIEGDAPVQTINFWATPALIAVLWLAAASFALSELATVVPSLSAASPSARAAAVSGPAILEARRPVSAHRR